MGQSPHTPASSGGLEPNVAALLGYLFWPLAIVWLVLDPYKQDRFVRFHAFQSLALMVTIVALSIALMILSVIFGVIGMGGLAALLWPVLWLAILVVWILLMVKAYQKEMWKLPVVGPFCEKQAG